MLNLRGLVYRYAGATGDLSFPDLALPQGAALLIKGPSGSGKSTLLALMAGLLRLQRGQLQVGSADLAALPPREVDAWRGRELGFVPQRLHLSAGLDVAANLSLPYLAAGLPVDRARVDEVLRQLGLAGLGSRRPHTLSVGQAQRVALARAVLRRPRVLLADEPTAHLDDASARAAVALLAQVAHAGSATLVIATHDARVLPWLPGARAYRLGARPEPASESEGEGEGERGDGSAATATTATATPARGAG